MTGVDREALRALFDGEAPMTVGVEEEAMLLDPETLDLAPRAEEALAAVAGDPRFTRELPASQIEIVLPPARTAGEAAAALARARADLAQALGGELLVACAGVHPFAAPLGELSRGARYEAIAARYGDVARAQLVCALQVHVRVGGAERAIAVHDALRGELPLVAALAAHAPVHAGRDTGFASIRPLVGGLLPRQGVPPALGTFDAYCDRLDELEDPAQWWWEVRPHRIHGTLEVRVPDAQATVDDAAAVVAVVHALVTDLAARYDAGEELPRPTREEVEEDRWRAAKEGATGALGERLHALLDRLDAYGERLECTAELTHARSLADHGPAERLRDSVDHQGLEGALQTLAARYTPEQPDARKGVPGEVRYFRGTRKYAPPEPPLRGRRTANAPHSRLTTDQQGRHAEEEP